MKKLLYLAALIILASSCKTTKLGVGKVKKADPFVELRTGEVIQGQKGDKVKKTGFFQHKLKINDTAVKAQDVAFYSDGKNTYANVKTGNIFGKKSFAKKITEGKVNIYRQVVTVSSTSYGPAGGMGSMGSMGGGMGGMGGGMGGAMGFSHSSHHENVDYIQLATSKEVMRLNYKNLKPMIPESSSGAWDQLEIYRRHRTSSRIVTYSGLAMIVAGAALFSSSDAWLPVALGGVAASFTGLAIANFNHKHLYKSIEAYNKYKK